MGFGATDDDEPAPEVRDGVASERELSPAELFVGLCERLRAMGATEVRAERFRAVFGAQQQAPAQPAVAVTRVQLTPPKPREPEEPLTAYEGEQLSEDDKARRRRYRAVMGGDT